MSEIKRFSEEPNEFGDYDIVEDPNGEYMLYGVHVERIKQLEQELADTKKSIKSVIQHYEDGAVYFERNYEAFYTDSFQELMVDIYKKHDDAVIKESSK